MLFVKLNREFMLILILHVNFIRPLANYVPSMNLYYYGPD